MPKKNMVSLAVWGGVTLLLIVLPVCAQSRFVVHLLTMIFSSCVVVTSLWLTWRIGQTTLGHAAFLSIGAYTSSILALRLGLSFWLILPLGIAAAVIIAIPFGYTTIRLKGLYYYLATFSFGEALVWLYRTERCLLGGTAGIANIPPPVINIPGVLTIDFLAHDQPYYYLAMLFALGSGALIAAIDRSRIGAIVRGIGQSDTLAESVGIDVTCYKVVIFTIACGLASVAGIFNAHYIRVIHPDIAGVFNSTQFVICMVIGGTSSLAGSVFGAALLTIVPELLRRFSGFEFILFGAVLLMITMFLPNGVISIPQILRSSIGKVNKD